jgi:prepilin-type processing-associated H-X9-DG protein/prepilin-type N-terminal cleavage/methylation domain-containing protein
MIQRTTHHGRPAFTLVELLVVIGIIAILLAITLPAMAGARRQARLVRCSASLQSIGQACMLHANSNNGYLPLAGRVTAPPDTDHRNYPAGLNDPGRRRYTYANVPAGGGVGASVVPFIAALSRNLGITAELPDHDWNALDQALNARDGVWQRFICPDTDSMEKAKVNANPNDSTVADQGTMMICAVGTTTFTAWASNSDYAANEGVFGYHYDDRYRRNRLAGKLSAVRRASQVVLFTDGVPRKVAADPIMPLGWITWTPSLDGAGPATLGDAMANNGRADSPENFDLNRHGKRMNVVFADGHVEAFPVTKEALDHAYLVAR